MARCRSFVSWVVTLAAAGWVALAHGAVGVTPQMLDLERNPVDSLAVARQQLAALPDTSANREQRLEWSLQATVAALMVGDGAQFKSQLEASRRLARDLDDAYGLALVRALESGAQGAGGRPAEAVAAARDALQQSERLQDPMSRTFVRDMAAWGLLAAKRYAEAEPYLREALLAYTQHGAAIRRVITEAGLASLADGLRDPISAYQGRQAALKALGSEDAPYVRAYLTWALGKDSLLAGDPLQARRHFETALAESHRIGDPAGILMAAQQGLAIADADQGRWAEAERTLSSVQPRLLSAGQVDLWLPGQATLARALAEQGRGPAAEAALAPAREKAAAMADGSSKLWFLEREAGVMLVLGQPGRAAELTRAALDMERRLHAAARQTQISDLMVRHEVARHERDKAELRLRSELAEARLREQSTRQQLMVVGLVLGGAVLGLLGLTLWNQVRSRRHFSALALTDPLTGSPNRRAILENLQTLLDRGTPGLVGLLDIDHFKRINDRHGHATGDAVLAAFYQACVDGRTQAERVGRLGGEEWLMLVEQATPGDASALFGRVRGHFQRRAAEILPPGEPAPSFSMGACPLQPGLDVSATLALADAALYEAKAQGRDRVVSQPPAG
ncbi:MAG: GGDEF domain-containing protein, partial [Rubrivivax sp.]|nr:GGDEF domain-containing protein [Rubrivivax sp.]